MGNIWKVLLQEFCVNTLAGHSVYSVWRLLDRFGWCFCSGGDGGGGGGAGCVSVVFWNLGLGKILVAKHW